MSIELPWMRPEAPYMPIATAGLLSALADAGTPAFAVWRPSNHGHTLWLETDRTVEVRFTRREKLAGLLCARLPARLRGRAGEVKCGVGS